MTLAERMKMPSESETPANAEGVGQPMREASLAAPNGYAAPVWRWLICNLLHRWSHHGWSACSLWWECRKCGRKTRGTGGMSPEC